MELSFPPTFGQGRALEIPDLERIDITAGDGKALCLHHTSGGTKGPVIVAPGTAMTALTYCADSVPENLVEYFVKEGFDVWLFDWRTSPLLNAHTQSYRFEDVARYDWPAAIDEVKQRTGAGQVSVLAHCLSSPCFLLSLLRGYTARDAVKSFVASQVALHLVYTSIGTIKVKAYLDKLLPGDDMIHQKPDESQMQIGDLAATVLARLLPASFDCDNAACYRQAATFGELIYHPRINDETHALMGDLVPECLTAFLKDVAVWSRQGSVLTDDDERNIERLQLPIHFISGSENRMFVPESTRQSYQYLCDRNGPSYYRRSEYEGFGHLDCYFGDGARETIWPEIAESLNAD